MNRLWLIIKSKFSRAVDRAENPRETLDYAYEQQLQLLQDVKRGIAEVVTAKKRLELSAGRLGGQAEKLEGQARAALGAGREDLARHALERRSGIQAEMRGLEEQVGALDRQQEELLKRQRAYADKVERFRSEKEVIKAQYTAAEAMVQIGEATTGIGEGLADAGRAIQRARDKTDTMQARAAAIDELVEAGALEDQLAPGETAIDRELAQLASRADVDAELARLKSETGLRKPLELEQGNS